MPTREWKKRQAAKVRYRNRRSKNADNPANKNVSNMQRTDDEAKDLERMVNVFRVQELKQLLIYAHQPQSGRKTELTNRVLALVRSTKCDGLKAKVKQLYSQIYDRDRALLESNGGAPVGTNPSPYGAYAPALSGGGNVQTMANGSNDRSVSSWLSQAAARQNLSLHPNVKLTHLPFYDVISEVIKPTTLVPLVAGKFQENSVPFVLSRQQQNMISLTDKAPLPRIGLQLRFCLLDLNGEQKDDFPSGCVLRLNDKVVQIPNPIPTNKVGVEPKRPSRPVDLTPYIVRGQDGAQRIHISWNYDSVRHWIVSVYVVRHLTTQILQSRVCGKGERPENDSINMIQEKLGGGDRDIAATSLRVSLLCPLGKIRMRLPCRLQSCKHLQCFDLELFLLMNEKRPTWTCPVCDAQIVPFSDLQVDGYFSRVLRAATENATEIELFEGGGFAEVLEEEDAQNAQNSRMESAGTSSSSCVTVTTISESVVSRPGSSATSTSHHRLDDEPVVIDLISDDDDDQPTSSSKRPNNWPMKSRDRTVSSCSSPSLIILDSPASPDRTTPDDPGTSEDFTRAIAPKRSLISSGSEPSSPPRKRCMERTTTTASSSSDSTRPPSESSLFNPIGYSQPVNGEIPGCYSAMMRLLDQLRDNQYQQQRQYASVPPPVAYANTPVTQPTTMPNLLRPQFELYQQQQPISSNGLWRPLLHNPAVPVSSPMVPSTSSSTIPNCMNEEFEAFLRSCIPQQEHRQHDEK